MDEIYKAIPGYEGKYEVSNFGNVRSYLKGGEPQIKSLRLTMGYPTCDLFGKGKDNKKTCRVHILVAMAFLGHQPNGHQTVINHIDNNPLNNRVDNLEIVTPRINATCHKTDAGVYWNIKSQKWFSMIRIKAYNNQKLYLGGYDNKEQALRVYHNAVLNVNKFENKEQFRKLVSEYDIMKY